MKEAVIGMADSQMQAERIVTSLHEVGFTRNDISVLLPDKQGTKDFAHEQNTKAPEGAVAGVGAGVLSPGQARCEPGHARAPSRSMHRGEPRPLPTQLTGDALNAG